MASITQQPGGQRLIQFIGSEGKRKTIRLGKVPQRVAEAIRVKVESLLATAWAHGSVDPETARWLSHIGEDLADKFAAAGLIPRRASARLAEFVDAYIERRSDVKPNTRKNFLATRTRLVEFFGADKNLRDVSPGDADAWLLALRARYADASIALFLKRARQFFRSAVRQRLLRDNPFGDLKIPCEANKEREYFLTSADTHQLLDACPDAGWRLLVALSRFGGLRCPSEHLALQWQDVHWQRGRLRVPSSKTAHFEGHGERWVPLFPELRVYLQEAFEQARPGAVYVISRYRGPKANLRTQLKRIIRRAGLTAWPRLFQSMRASRQTELAAQYPLHVVCAWLGNSIRIASKHYLQVTEADFQRAAKGEAPAPPKALQPAAAPRCTDSQKSPEALGCCDVVPNDATGCE